MRTHALIMVNGRTGIPEAKNDGEIRPVWGDERGRFVIKSFNQSKGALDVSVIDPALMTEIRRVFPQLTAPGNTAGVEVSTVHNHTFSVDVANINTSVDIRFEGRIGDGTFENIDESDADITISANGTRIYYLSNFEIDELRCVFVSESGGTTATLDFKYKGGN